MNNNWVTRQLDPIGANVAPVPFDVPDPFPTGNTSPGSIFPTACRAVAKANKNGGRATTLVRTSLESEEVSSLELSELYVFSNLLEAFRVVGVEGHVAAVHMDDRHGLGAEKYRNLSIQGVWYWGRSSWRMSRRRRRWLRRRRDV